MIQIKDKAECAGCSACAAICPARCIQLRKDEEGFLYPAVDRARCVQCGKCERVCPVLHPFESHPQVMAFACKSKDQEGRAASSSGGVFSLLAQEVIDASGVVFGAWMGEDLVCRHKGAQTREGCLPFRGSKYVQSDPGNTFGEAREALLQGRRVLYSGTPCQIAGLKHFLGEGQAGLLCVDFICHGTPSADTLAAYLSELSQKAGSPLASVQFRCKEKGWKRFPLLVTYQNGSRQTIEPDDYIQGFSQNLYLRPACYRCAANNFRSGSDLTLADYWGVETAYPDFDDEQGVSLVLCRTAAGQEAFERIGGAMDLRPASLTHAAIFQKNLTASPKLHADRGAFFQGLSEGQPFSRLAKRYIRSSPVYRLKRFLPPRAIRRLQYLLAKGKGV